jgi:DNA-binding NarL/FixJ family response regulator
VGEHVIKILVADRSRLVLDAVQDLLEQLGGETQVLTADSLAAAKAIATTEQPQLVLVDAWIRRGPAEDAVREILGCSPGSWLVVMASDFDPDLVRRLSQAGARDCLEKMNLAATVPDIVDLVRPKQ